MKTIIFVITLLLTIFRSNLAQAEYSPNQATTIYEVLNVLPVASKDRDDPRKQDQLYTIAVAIERAVIKTKWLEKDKVSLTAYLITIGYHESKFGLKVHEGYRHAYSYGIWQITPSAYGVKRLDLIGLSQDETDHTAEIAARAVSTSWGCGSSPADHFTAYYGGVPCKTDWPTLRQRVGTFWYVRNLLVRFGDR